MRKELESFSGFEEMMMPLRERLMDEYEKSQWSTFIINALSLKSFDMEGFIKETPLYRKWATPILSKPQAQGTHSPSFVKKVSEKAAFKVRFHLRSKSEWLDSRQLD